MARLIRASFLVCSTAVRQAFGSLCNNRCADACQLDLELMRLRTNLTQQSGWSAAGIQ
jgi:hypothetical protein